MTLLSDNLAGGVAWASYIIQPILSTIHLYSIPIIPLWMLDTYNIIR